MARTSTQRYLCEIGTTAGVLGDKGRVVVPAAVRERLGWQQGAELILVETPDGLLLTERRTALRIIRDTLTDHDPRRRAHRRSTCGSRGRPRRLMRAFDASALLAFLRGAQRTAIIPSAWPLARDVLLSFAVTVDTVTRVDAEVAAAA